MSKSNDTKSPLFRSPVRTLTPAELARVNGAASTSPRVGGKPSTTPIDQQGFR